MQEQILVITNNLAKLTICTRLLFWQSRYKTFLPPRNQALKQSPNISSFQGETAKPPILPEHHDKWTAREWKAPRLFAAQNSWLLSFQILTAKFVAAVWSNCQLFSASTLISFVFTNAWQWRPLGTNFSYRSSVWKPVTMERNQQSNSSPSTIQN